MVYVKYRLQTGGPDNRAAARGRKIQHVYIIYVLYLHCSVFYTDPLIKENWSLMQNKFRINRRPNSDWRASSRQLSIWQHLWPHCCDHTRAKSTATHNVNPNTTTRRKKNCQQSNETFLVGLFQMMDDDDDGFTVLPDQNFKRFNTTCVSTIGQFLHQHTANKWTSHSRGFWRVCLLHAVKSIAVIAPSFSFFAKKNKKKTIYARMGSESEWEITGTKGDKKKQNKQKKLVDFSLNVSKKATSCDGFSEEQLSVNRRLPAAFHSITRPQNTRAELSGDIQRQMLCCEEKKNRTIPRLFGCCRQTCRTLQLAVKLNFPHILMLEKS